MYEHYQARMDVYILFCFPLCYSYIYQKRILQFISILHKIHINNVLKIKLSLYNIYILIINCLHIQHYNANIYIACYVRIGMLVRNMFCIRNVIP